MTTLLATPWLRLPRLLAIYFAIAITSPLVFFITYELAALSRSHGTLEEKLNSPTLLLAIILVCFLGIPYLYSRLTRREDKPELLSLYSRETVTELTSSLFASLSFGLYLQEQSTQAQLYDQLVRNMRFMLANAAHIKLADAHLKSLHETKKALDHAHDATDSEFHILLTKFLEKYQETHPDALS